jgi:hypothetical protein
MSKAMVAERLAAMTECVCGQLAELAFCSKKLFGIAGLRNRKQEDCMYE